MISFGNNYSLNDLKVAHNYGQLNYASTPNKSTLAQLEKDTFTKTTTAKEPLIEKDKNGKITNIIEFDSVTGNKIKDTFYQKDGKTILYIREYNPQTGNITKATSYQEDGKTVLHISEYDPTTGNRIKDIGYQEDGKTISHIAEYNPLTDKEIKATFYKKDGKTIEAVFTPDSQKANN